MFGPGTHHGSSSVRRHGLSLDGRAVTKTVLRGESQQVGCLLLIHQPVDRTDGAVRRCQTPPGAVGARRAGTDCSVGLEMFTDSVRLLRSVVQCHSSRTRDIL